MFNFKIDHKSIFRIIEDTFIVINKISLAAREFQIKYQHIDASKTKRSNIKNIIFNKNIIIDNIAVHVISSKNDTFDFMLYEINSNFKILKAVDPLVFFDKEKYKKYIHYYPVYNVPKDIFIELITELQTFSKLKAFI